MLISNSASASVPFADHWPEHEDPAPVRLPQRGQVQFHQQGKVHLPMYRLCVTVVYKMCVIVCGGCLMSSTTRVFSHWVNSELKILMGNLRTALMHFEA